MFEDFRNYIESIKIASIVEGNNTFNYTLYTNSVIVRKKGFAMIHVDFIKDRVKLDIEFYLREIEKEKNRKEKIEELLIEINDKKYNATLDFLTFSIHTIMLRFDKYDEFIKCFDKYILDL